MSGIFNDKVALVTGGTTGIGRAAALAFAEKGATVVVTGRREEEGRKTVDLIAKAGGKAQFFRSDVSSEADCKEMVENVVAKFGRLDCAFNNAGIEGLMVPTTEQSDENFHKVMNINVLGVMNSMKYEIPAMLKNGGGAIVNTASIAGMIGLPGMSVYCASKHAVIGLSKVAALEFSQHGVRVNALSPAAIETEMYDRFTGGDKAMQDQFASTHPIGRIGQPDEVAKAVTFLCSPEAGFITGINVPVDGGYTAQ
jgi:NAD(P)-dependent dehydrogenase (short-subunit alcohol dehydrogenase family)